MGTTFRPYQPDQMLLLPQDLREWVPEGHLAHHVSDLVDALDLGAFYAPYKGDGRRNSPYDPRMMVKVQREYGEPDAKAQSNFTDPESRIMKTSSEGFQQCYNAQTVVDGDNQVVVATTVTESASDQGQLIPMVDAVRDAFGETPEQVLADAGYCSEPNLQALKERDIDGYVSLAREGTAVMDPDPDKYPAKARMAKKLASEEGRRRYARRKWMAEAPVGWIKEVMGFRRFSFRGLEKVQAEWDLVCLALNVKRLHTLRAA